MAHPETQKPAPCVPVSTACAQCPNPGPGNDLSDATGSDAAGIGQIFAKAVRESVATVEFYYRESRSLDVLEAEDDYEIPTQAELIRLLVRHHGWVVVQPGNLIRPCTRPAR